MIDYAKYEYTGWGLSEEALRFLEDLITQNSLTRAVEFGSGQSTYFLKDVGIDYISFEADPIFAAKTDKVIIRDIKQLDDNTFNEIINGEISPSVCSKFPPPKEITTRMKNCFYNIKLNDIKGKFDLVIIDGPNGNGRSIAYNTIKPYLSPISYIFVDDYNHYPFIDHLKTAFPNNELVKSYEGPQQSLGSSIGDCWQVYKVIL